jgi:ribosomal protein S18 acetylase RimI-like enzyme
MLTHILLAAESDPTISVGAFDTDTGECVSLVLNSILKDKENTAYDIITCTIPEYRRRGIARTIFEKVKVLLRERGIEIYTTETKRDNVIAQSMYRSLGFEITNEVVTTLKTLTGSRQVEQVEVVMKL